MKRKKIYIHMCTVTSTDDMQYNVTVSE
jgi:hypothetical protein